MSIPGPYSFQEFNCGNGGEILNNFQELTSVDNVSLFKKLPVLRQPTENNPMMNVMPLNYDTELIFSDYNRYTVYPDNEVRQSVEDNFNIGLIQSPDSVIWNKLNSQRQFISMPVGGVPADQGEFANFLYGIKNNCKHGSIYQGRGIQYSDDSLMCNGFNVTEPTNFGLLDNSLMRGVFDEESVLQ